MLWHHLRLLKMHHWAEKISNFKPRLGVNKMKSQDNPNNQKPGDIKRPLSVTVSVGVSVTGTIESHHLRLSNKEKVRELLSNSELNENDIIDVFISLHIILEVSLNSLFRQLYLLKTEQYFDRLEVIKNLDEISFIDKVRFFIYNSKFKFQDINKAKKYQKIIGTLRNFACIRNQLLHGHSIITVIDDGGTRSSSTKKRLNKDHLKKQLEDFLFILKGLRYYLDCLVPPLKPSVKESCKKDFLNDSFIPDSYKS